ncbi:Aste57867_24265 [Aphanomyces stellatus]|uniref:Aste57867_24265 protein n=1 Tax=Aphanomyces stellatus TaxID=120398 RepID=A0A485LQ02_9STRA|nr:hypothetical protein As57867_024190 [Aphanomyces stellatus]VFU00905.1 Aste57867_24265 [Aphanomyces stellatus]
MASSLRQRAIQERGRQKEGAHRVLPYTLLENEDKQIVLDRIHHELTPLLPQLKTTTPEEKQLVAVGVNAVTRLVERGGAGVVVVAMHPSTENILWPLLSMTLSFDVPICVVAATSHDLGALLGVKSASAMAVGGAIAASTVDALTSLASIRDYLVTKRSVVA